MHRFSACLAVGAMLFALVSAPLFHVHDRDDHGNALVHTHFLESENPLSNSGHAVEGRDSHGHVRWVDVFTLNTPATTVFHAVAEFSAPLLLPAPVASRARVAAQTLRAHSPPEAPNLAPRSPPAL